MTTLPAMSHSLEAIIDGSIIDGQSGWAKGHHMPDEIREVVAHFVATDVLKWLAENSRLPGFVADVRSASAMLEDL